MTDELTARRQAKEGLGASSSTGGLTLQMEQTIVSGSAAARTASGQADCAPNTSPSPEQGRRLIEAFLRIQREDLREEVFKHLSELLRVQEGD